MAEVIPQDYLQGARNFYQFAGIKPGEQVLLLPTSEFMGVDPITVTALTQAGKDLGAEISVALIEDCGIRGNPPRPITRAIESCDFFLAIGEDSPNPISGHCLTALKARWDYGRNREISTVVRGFSAPNARSFPSKFCLPLDRAFCNGFNTVRKSTLSTNGELTFPFPTVPTIFTVLG